MGRLWEISTVAGFLSEDIKRYQQKYNQTACFANISKFDKEALKLMKLFLLGVTGGDIVTM